MPPCVCLPTTRVCLPVYASLCIPGYNTPSMPPMVYPGYTHLACLPWYTRVLYLPVCLPMYTRVLYFPVCLPYTLCRWYTFLYASHTPCGIPYVYTSLYAPLHSLGEWEENSAQRGLPSPRRMEENPAQRGSFLPGCERVRVNVDIPAPVGVIE